MKNLSFKHVLLIGSGQLGSRYLQGLVGVGQELLITVVDPSASSLELARQRLADVTPVTSHEVRFSTSIDDAPRQLDLALVVTPAHCRAEVVAAIAAQHKVNAWILEKLLAQSSQQVDQIETALEGHSRVWVNIPRRLMTWHQEIKAQLLDSCPPVLLVRIRGCNWELASSAIHYIDLVNWWTNCNIDRVDCRGLQNWQPSKRSGFQDVQGTLLITFGKDIILELHSCKTGPYQPQIAIETPDGVWLIDEEAGQAAGPSGQEIAGHLTLQSALIAPLVEQILAAGSCELPSLADSAAQHRPLLDALRQHWNYSQSRQDVAVPIT